MFPLARISTFHREMPMCRDREACQARRIPEHLLFSGKSISARGLSLLANLRVGRVTLPSPRLEEAWSISNRHVLRLNRGRRLLKLELSSSRSFWKYPCYLTRRRYVCACCRSGSTWLFCNLCIVTWLLALLMLHVDVRRQLKVRRYDEKGLLRGMVRRRRETC